MSKNYFNSNSAYYGSGCGGNTGSGSGCGGNTGSGSGCGGNGGSPIDECDEYLRQYVVGNSVDFDIDECDSEIKADITVGTRETVRVWGQIRDCDGNSVPYAYLKLVRVSNNGMEGIAHTVMDIINLIFVDVQMVEMEQDLQF